MPVDTPTLFSQVIQDHLELKERNSELDHELPLDRYKNDDPFDNHPLFKTEEQARLEETMDGAEAAVFANGAQDFVWPGETAAVAAASPEENTLWTRSRDFDWGD
jgi:hypothetical protein